jgi:phage tail tape-measure protein
MRRQRAEAGQATVEWTGLLLLVALVLAAAAHLASKADGKELGTTLAHSVTHPGRPVVGHDRLRGAPFRPGLRAVPAPGRLRAAPAPAVERPPAPVPRPPARAEEGLAREVLRRAAREGARRAGRGAGILWRRAWFACLAYERTRYAFQHPESRFPGYQLPYGDAIRMINGCVSPVDLLRDLPGLDPGLDPVP